MSVNLIIKSAAQSVDDFALSCEMSWTIAQVKDEISSLYPTKPKKEHQKLIYGGKLLPDHLSLQSALNKNQDVHILHIVCPFSSTNDSKKTETSSKKSDSSPVPETPIFNPGSVYTQMNPNVLPASYPSIPGFAYGTTYNSVPDMTQQYFAVQQMYTQMMTQYFTQYNGSNPYGQVNTHVPSVQPPEPVIPRQDAPPRQANDNRDYLDYLFMLSRWVMMLALLLSYSSISRIMAVMGMVLILTMFAKINRQRQQEARDREHAESIRTRQSEPESIVDEEVPENLPGTESSPQPETTNQTATSAPSFFTVITAFFSSLIPTEPLPPVNVN